MAFDWLPAPVILSILAMARGTSMLEIVAAALIDLSSELKRQAPGGLSTALLRVFVSSTILPILLRLVMVLSMILHEWAHLLLSSAILVTRHFPSVQQLVSIWSLKNLAGGLSLDTWLQAIRPYSSLPDGLSPRVEIPSNFFTELHNKSHQSSFFQTEDSQCLGSKRKVHVIMKTLDQHSLVGLGGWAFSVILSVYSSSFPNQAKGHLAYLAGLAPLKFEQPFSRIWTDLMTSSAQCVYLGILLTAVGSTASDLLGIGTEHASSGGKSFFCGNFGMIIRSAASEARKAAVGAMDILEEMCAISSERGGQSGGLVTLLRTGSAVRGMRERVIPGKRESLAKKLLGRFRLRMIAHYVWTLMTFIPLRIFGEGSREKTRNLSGTDIEQGPLGNGEPNAAAAGSGELVQIFAGHTRFATSSIPSAGETHPHQWCPRRALKIWKRDAVSGAVELRSEHSDIFITHNGDLEYYNIFGRDRTHAELGPWLEAVLGVRQPAHCDSVMIAGMMDLLRTQGIWSASLRLAYHQTVMVSYEEVFSSEDAVPQQGYWDALGGVIDGAFEGFVDKWQSSKGEGRGHAACFHKL